MVSWSSDDALLLADGYNSSTLRRWAILWDFAHDADARNLEIKHPTNPNSSLTRCIFAKDGHSLICGWSNGDITCWDLRSGRTTRELKRHTSYIRASALSRDGRLLASSCDEYKICIWTVASGECAHELRGHSFYVFRLAFTNDATGLISGGRDGRITLWDTATGSSLKKWGARTRVYVAGDNDGVGYGEDDNEEDDNPTFYDSLAVL